LNAAAARWGRGIQTTPRFLRLAIASSPVASVAELDSLTGPDLGVSNYHLPPLSFAASFISRRAGWTVAVTYVGVRCTD